jgi:tetratricopeptide (TPR) repeat protein
MRFRHDVPVLQDDEHGRMSVSQFEQLDRYEDHDESRDRSLLQTTITEAFAFLNAGAGQEAIARIKRYRDLAARSDAGCYIFGLIYFIADDMRHALAWFDCALELRPSFPEALSPAPSFFNGLVNHRMRSNRLKRS